MPFGYSADSGSPFFGQREFQTTSPTGKARRVYGEPYKEYGELTSELRTDPLMQALRGKALGFETVARQSAQRAADVRTSALQSALAARGGGSLASALSLGAQARTPFDMFQAYQGGMGALQQALTAQWSPLTSIYGSKMGVSAAQVAGKSREEAAKTAGEASIWSSAISGLLS